MARGHKHNTTCCAQYRSPRTLVWQRRIQGPFSSMLTSQLHGGCLALRRQMSRFGVHLHLASLGPLQAHARAFHSTDGQLMLRLVAFLEVFRPPLCCLEQVEGFRKHRHFSTIEEAREAAGYVQVWGRTIDVVDCASETRKRFLLVLARRDIASECKPMHEQPVLPKRPTLGTFNCLPQMPVMLSFA